MFSRLVEELKLPDPLMRDTYLFSRGVSRSYSDECDIDEQSMNQAISEAVEQAKECQDHGRLNVALSISQNGTAEVTSEFGSLKDSEAEKCILEKLSSHQYPTYSCSGTDVSDDEELDSSNGVYETRKEIDLYTKAYIDSFKTRMASKDIYTYQSEKKVKKEESDDEDIEIIEAD